MLCACLSLPLCRLEQRWVLWHEFMKEHDHLDAWLQLAEQAIGCPNSAHVNYSTAKEELQRFEVCFNKPGFTGTVSLPFNILQVFKPISCFPAWTSLSFCHELSLLFCICVRTDACLCLMSVFVL